MRRPSRRLSRDRRALIAIGLAGVAVAAPVAAQEATPTPAEELRLSDVRHVEIEDTRIVSMSPDGRWLVGTVPAVGYLGGQLCVFAIDTLAQRSCADLSDLGAGIRLEDVTWSPDGQHLAFGERAFLNLQDGDLWLMDAASGELTNLDDDGFEGTLPFLRDPEPGLITVPVSPAFSPDGSTIAFSRSLFQDGQRRGNVIATVPVTGGEITHLATVDPEMMGIAYFGMGWSPDGSELYYSVHDPDPDDLRNGIWVVSAAGGDARLLLGRYQPESAGPAFLQAREGTLLVYDPQRMGRFGFDGSVYALLDRASGEATPLTLRLEDPARGAFVNWASLSPDGGSVALLSRLTDPDFQVWVRDVDAPQDALDLPLLPDGLEVAGPVERGLAPTWSTNGTLFLTGGGGLSQGSLLTIEGGTGSSAAD